MVMLTVIITYSAIKKIKQKKPFRLKVSIAIVFLVLTSSLFVIRGSLFIYNSRSVSLTLHTSPADNLYRLECGMKNPNDSGGLTETRNEFSYETYEKLIEILNGATYKYLPFFNVHEYHSGLISYPRVVHKDLRVDISLKMIYDELFLWGLYIYEDLEGNFHSYIRTEMIKTDAPDWTSKTYTITDTNAVKEALTLFGYFD